MAANKKEVEMRLGAITALILSLGITFTAVASDSTIVAEITISDTPIAIGETIPLNMIVGAYPELGIISGHFRSKGNRQDFKFSHNKSFTYKLHKNGDVNDGAYEKSSCVVSQKNTGELLDQGNFIFYFNGTSCCYNVKWISDARLLVLSRVWEKGFNDNLCPSINLKLIPSK